jgi:hypothetical protein
MEDPFERFEPLGVFGSKHPAAFQRVVHAIGKRQLTSQPSLAVDPDSKSFGIIRTDFVSFADES